jgi:arginyl-tRNA synthetase
MNLKEKIKSFTAEAVEKVYGEKLDFIPLLYPDQKSFGDYATSSAMVLAKKLKKNPKEIAAALAQELGKREEFEKVEVAGAGFVNFFLGNEFINSELLNVLENVDYGKNDSLKGRKILLEFVSANPTGPLHIGHGRWAAIGDTLARMLRFCGADVSTEFYINDAGNQINLLLQSVAAVKEGKEVPENGYHGAYIQELAAKEGDPVELLLETQKKTLLSFGVDFDRYFSEKELHQGGKVKDTLEFLKKSGYGYEKEGAFWFKSTEFGDDKDRVLVKSDGEMTYFAVDIAYHRNKISRNFNELITVLGADHHGYVKRMEAAVKVLCREVDKNINLSMVIGQLVNLFRDGEPVRMSKRTGDMISLDEVIEEIGVDAGRYFLVMRKADTPLDFDMGLAKKKSDENPVFYVQYAHARISGILRNYSGEIKKNLLEIVDSPESRDLAVELVKFPEAVEEAAASLEPHRIPIYLENLANLFHRFYHQNRVISEDREATEKRILLIQAARNIIRKGLFLIGVDSPEKM